MTQRRQRSAEELSFTPVEGLVKETVNRKLAEFLEETPADARRIAAKAVDAARARQAARKARDANIAKRRECSFQGNRPPSTMAPPSVVPCPPMNFVNECTTTSAP